MKFLVMRLSFINPIEMPVLSETFLRHDFDFTLYITYALSKKISTLISPWIVTITVLLIFWKILNFLSTPIGISILYTLPPILISITLIFSFRFQYILSKLTPSIDHPECINFQPRGDPFDQFDNYLIPSYLQDVNHKAAP